MRLKQVAPRCYQANVPLWGHGRYHVSATGKGGERNENAFGGFIVPYSPEYLRFRSNRQTLSDIASRTGGYVLSGNVAEDLQLAACGFRSGRRDRSSTGF